MKKPTQSMADMLMQSVAAPSVTAASPAATPMPEAGEKLVAFGQRITATHKEQLSRLAFWSRRNERLLLDRALSEFFARQDPELLRPIPEE
ncbi:hypothetical protein D0N36_19890 [Hymenobacter lapidiphilus]|uniref:hypothetical protein n=1 Tax=Hymenobacter sp. CCM 8763 TaxID=2303334 RepID=UPI000E342EA3|nr:hypothetical protein [Hymenobacter sp. CCM 8763]RFP63346.1 hypothetical protein D0N36_19890 [Hymenobacter sp. CCM 8763]